MIQYLIPVPFLLVMIASLLRKDKRLGYLGAIAGGLTLWMVLSVWNDHGVSAAEWFTAGTTFHWSVMIDQLSLLLAAIVAGIGTLIFLYSVGYLDETEDLSRFYAELSLFAAAMLAVVTAGNLFQLFFAWELVGVSSYLLIGFWHDKQTAIAAARKAFITVIIGDAFLLAGILLLWNGYGTFDIATILAAAQANQVTMIAGVCIIIGAISKSAQFPLHTWLPDAMEGPTPVSAFLHSATMVKAGLFLIARFLPLLVLAGLSPLLMIIAVITIILSACMALVENDIKRVLAYSTMNQLAFILLAFSVGATVAGLYHLLNHSIFKALLFMAAGAIIHLAGTQDIRQMNLKLGPNMIAVTTLIGVLALAGLPPLSGFFSKDAIFEAVLETHNMPLIIVFSVAVVLSAAYIFRWFLLIFRKNGHMEHVHWQMRVPLPILAFLTVIGGLTMIWFYPWMDANAHFGIASLLSILLAGTGAAFAYLVYHDHKLSIERIANTSLAAAFRERFLFDELYGFFANVVYDIGLVCAWIDSRIDSFLIGITRFCTRLGAVLRLSVTGQSTTYLFAVITGFILIALLVRFA